MSSEAPAAERRRRVSSDTRRLIVRLQDRALRAVMLSLPSGEPREYLYDLLPQYPQRSGKGLRPVLCMAACSAFGGSYEEAIPFAAALELLHNAFLVHDDIQDGSPVRRGGRALHVEHGMPLALNAGAALAAHAHATYLRAARPLGALLEHALLEGWERTIHETIEGQALDLGWQRDNRIDCSMPDYLAMCAKKTSWYTAIQPLGVGAIVGSRDQARDREVFRFGWLLGLLVQTANDLAGLHAPAGQGDIEEGKRTVILVHLLDALDGADREKLVRIMGLPRAKRSAAEVGWVRSKMDTAGSIDYAEACVADLESAAQQEADRAFRCLPVTEGRDLLLSMPAYVVKESLPPGSRRRVSTSTG